MEEKMEESLTFFEKKYIIFLKNFFSSLKFFHKMFLKIFSKISSIKDGRKNVRKMSVIMEELLRFSKQNA